MKHYKFLDLSDSIAPDVAAIKEAINCVVDSGRFIGGREVERFEERLASIHGVNRECVSGVSNGLDALRLIFRAYIEAGRLKPGDEVIVPSNTYIASVLAVTDNNLVPVFAEPDIYTYNIDGRSVEKVITPQTKAVMPVHLYGRPAWDAELLKVAKDNHLIVVEDNAQALGALAECNGLHGSRLTGTLGDAAAFSFYPTKNIGALGDAGATIAKDPEVAEIIRALRNYGSAKRYENIYAGLNCRLDSIQAAILNVRINRLEEESERRRSIADTYLSEIRHPAVSLPIRSEGSVWHQFVVRTAERDLFREYLLSNGVETDIHYPLPPHLQKCYHQTYGQLSLPVACELAESVTSLPMGASITVDDAKTIAGIINGYPR